MSGSGGMSSLGHGTDADRLATFWRCLAPGCFTPALEGLRYCDAHLDQSDALDRRLGIGGPLPQRRRKPQGVGGVSLAAPNSTPVREG